MSCSTRRRCSPCFWMSPAAKRCEAEIVSYYAKLGVTRADIAALLQPLPVRVVTIDADLSYAAAMLRPLTLKAGLSLGDRYCLALARQEGTFG